MLTGCLAAFWIKLAICMLLAANLCMCHMPLNIVTIHFQSYTRTEIYAAKGKCKSISLTHTNTQTHTRRHT